MLNQGEKNMADGEKIEQDLVLLKTYFEVFKDDVKKFNDSEDEDDDQGIIGHLQVINQKLQGEEYTRY